MPRREFKPNLKDPKFAEFIAEMKNMAEVGEWLVAAGYGRDTLHRLRKEIIESCEVIKVGDNYLIDSNTIIQFLQKQNANGGAA